MPEHVYIFESFKIFSKWLNKHAFTLLHTATLFLGSYFDNAQDLIF